MSRTALLYPQGRLILREVGLRDGLQLVNQWPATQAKIGWLAAEHAAGVRHFEVGSFLPAARMPQFVDVRAMIAAVGRLSGGRSAALALSERGVADALETAVDEIACVVSATGADSQANMRRSHEDAVALGNIMFEDPLFLAETMGFVTGIDIAALAEARAIAQTAMPNEAFTGAIARAGVPPPAWRAEHDAGHEE